jgi:sortase A
VHLSCLSVTGGLPSNDFSGAFPPPSPDEVLTRQARHGLPTPGSVIAAARPAAAPTADVERRTNRDRRKGERRARPPEPHDWRWFVGGLGRLLISLGLLIFAFVGYQLWGTQIQYQQSQNKLEKEFRDLRLAVAEAPAPATPTSIATTTTLIDPVTSEPIAPPTPDPATTQPAAVVAPALPTISLGNPVAFIIIKKIDLVSIVAAGVRTQDLKDAIGHFPDTPLPGQPGNAAIAGHRTTYGAPFGNLDQLAPGDRIIVESLQGHYEYVVEGSKIVPPSDYTVVANVPDQSLLTLITCHPKYTARERLVVTAVLDEATSDVLGEPVINYGRDPGDLESGDDGLAAEEPSAEGQADAGVDTTLAAGAPVEPDASTPAAIEPGVDPTTVEAADRRCRLNWGPRWRHRPVRRCVCRRLVQRRRRLATGCPVGSGLYCCLAVGVAAQPQNP